MNAENRSPDYDVETALRSAFARDTATPTTTRSVGEFVAAVQQATAASDRTTSRFRILVAAAAAVALIGGAVAFIGLGNDDTTEVRVGDRSTPVQLPAPGEVVEVPPPFGGFDAYNYVPVRNGNAVLVLGAATNTTPFSSGDLRFDDTKRAARLDLATGIWTHLPDLPVDEGLGSASAVELDGRLYVIGGDCKVTDSGSWQGVSFYCYQQLPIMLALSPDATSWERRATTMSTLTSDRGSTIVAVSQDSFVAWGDPGMFLGRLPGMSGGPFDARADLGAPRSFVSYDPVSDTWTETPAAPIPGHLCNIDGTMYAGAVVDHELQLARFDGGSWDMLTSPFTDTPVDAVICDEGGLFAVRSERRADGSVVAIESLWSSVDGQRRATLPASQHFSSASESPWPLENPTASPIQPDTGSGGRTVISGGVSYHVPAGVELGLRATIGTKLGDVVITQRTDSVENSNRTRNALVLWRLPE